MIRNITTVKTFKTYFMLENIIKNVLQSNQGLCELVFRLGQIVFWGTYDNVT
jgi:hypothetical protein